MHSHLALCSKKPCVESHSFHGFSVIFNFFNELTMTITQHVTITTAFKTLNSIHTIHLNLTTSIIGLEDQENDLTLQELDLTLLAK